MTCTWREDEGCFWHTDCGHTSQRPRVGQPICPYCSKPITEIAYDDDAEESE